MDSSSSLFGTGVISMGGVIAVSTVLVEASSSGSRDDCAFDASLDSLPFVCSSVFAPQNALLDSLSTKEIACFFIFPLIDGGCFAGSNLAS